MIDKVNTNFDKIIFILVHFYIHNKYQFSKIKYYFIPTNTLYQLYSLTSFIQNFILIFV